MSDVIKAACIQMDSGPLINPNLDRAEALIRQAAAQGATFIATPEITDQVISNRAEAIESTYAQSDHPGVPRFAALAKELAVDLLIGSMCIKVADDKVANRSFLFGRDGALKATYDKIHLYDVDLPTGESHRESKLFQPGDRAVTAFIGAAQKNEAQKDAAKIGMTICYDVRFPHLYRDLAKDGAQIIAVPAAFTVPTGQAHWEILLRARAIESGAFIIAPAQCGEHEGARQTYGHSAIIGPWGDILAAADGNAQSEGHIMADLDMGMVDKARAAIPALTHDRAYDL